jgi:hypothetical protein
MELFHSRIIKFVYSWLYCPSCLAQQYSRINVKIRGVILLHTQSGNLTGLQDTCLRRSECLACNGRVKFDDTWQVSDVLHVVRVLQTLCVVSRCSSLHYRRKQGGRQVVHGNQDFSSLSHPNTCYHPKPLFSNIPSTHARITKTTPWSILLRPNLVSRVTVYPRARPISSHPIVLKTLL